MSDNSVPNLPEPSPSPSPPPSSPVPSIGSIGSNESSSTNVSSDGNYTELNTLKLFLQNAYEELKDNNDGNVADYIPQLAKFSPDLFGISVCTVNGETLDIGDYDKYFCLQSSSKPLMYCYARKLHGLEYVHDRVGYEPTGTSFNSFILNENGLPHNPMVNAGAIMISSLIHPEKDPADRFECILNLFTDLCGGNKALCDMSMYLSEDLHADRNRSLAYFMRQSKAFGKTKPSPSQIEDLLKTYFQSCSIQITCQMGAIIASTLANGGICPITDKQIFDTETVRDCLTLMFSCGMYDFSGQFSFEVGLPAKSGVSGCILLVVPGKFGLCVWSPPLDKLGNSVRGIELCRRLGRSGPDNLHLFRHIGRQMNNNPDAVFYMFMEAVFKNNVKRVTKYLNHIDINRSDYDSRTAMHIACSDGNIRMISLLLEHNASPNSKDRWGNTPIDDLERFIKHNEDESSENEDDDNNYSQLLTALTSGE
jgi:glutaminase